MFLQEQVFYAMTVQGVRYQVTAPFCSKGCGRERRKGQRYCADCHRKDQRVRRYEQMTESQRLARAVKILDRMIRRLN